MSVQSKPMSNSQVITQAASTLPWRLGGVGALLVGFALWLIGARYTVLGGPRVLGLLLDLFGIDLTIPLPTSWALLGLTVAVGAIVSAVEFGCRPRRSYFSRSLLIGCAAVILWLLFNGADLASTFVGVTSVAPDSWPIARWVATAPLASGLWTTFLTYCPELLMIAGGRWLVFGRL